MTLPLLSHPDARMSRMGYRGKVVERERARELRAEGWPLAAIAAELGVSKGSVSVWVRDVAFTPRPRAAARPRGPNALQRRKQAEVEAGRVWGRQQIGELSDRDLLIAGTALYAGEGAKADGRVGFANTNPAMMALFCAWLRTFFDIDDVNGQVKVPTGGQVKVPTWPGGVRWWGHLLGFASGRTRLR
jgi:hypothetical protein